MKHLVSSLALGLLFGLGLIVSGMTDPDKVLAFLDLGGAWDPSLALVMVGAIGAFGLAFGLARQRPAPLWSGRFPELPTRHDGRLFGGAALFGLGWGLVGICPGPALVNLGGGIGDALIFVAAMSGGMLLHRALGLGRSGREEPGRPGPADQTSRPARQRPLRQVEQRL